MRQTVSVQAVVLLILIELYLPDRELRFLLLLRYRLSLFYSYLYN